MIIAGIVNVKLPGPARIFSKQLWSDMEKTVKLAKLFLQHALDQGNSAMSDHDGPCESHDV